MTPRLPWWACAVVLSVAVLFFAFLGSLNDSIAIAYQPHTPPTPMPTALPTITPSSPPEHLYRAVYRPSQSDAQFLVALCIVAVDQNTAIDILREDVHQTFGFWPNRQKIEARELVDESKGGCDG